MEDLDPEEARAIIDPALKLMIDAAHRYDGYGAAPWESALDPKLVLQPSEAGPSLNR